VEGVRGWLVDGWCISPFQPVKENWNAVTFLNQTASRPRAPDAGLIEEIEFSFRLKRAYE
jgi:hypothetical protein